MQKAVKDNLNKPSKKVLRLIKMANLVSFNTDLIIQPTEISNMSDQEADEYFLSFSNNLKTHKRLLRYFSFVFKKGRVYFEDAVTNFNETRKFVKILVELAAIYQERQKENKDRVKKSSEGIQKLIEFAEKNEDAANLVANLGGISGLKKALGNNTPLRGIHINNYSKEAAATRLFLYRNQTFNDLTRQLFTTAVNTLQIRVNKNHQLELNFGDLLDLINKIDLRRIKKCEICSKVVWAYRLNTKYCSKKCSNAFHQRIVQSQDKTKKQRRINYYYKNKIEYCETCGYRSLKCRCI